ncbi:MAG TPA: carboxypeptidase-like regulatory domain-containing protein, partial [Pyrinomonadaceae bacterium]|nr:carboxypeptidase-like regulatory domain-containing protein [Pyrinomonadaceae bacterium]
MKLFLTAGTLLLFCAYFLNEVHACTCVDYGVPTCSLFSNADAVFVGRIERITSAIGDKDASVQLGGVGSISSRGSGLIWVHFTLEHAFKGVNGKTVKALTYRGTSCDLGVKEGQRWLIFAQRDEETSNLSFGACDGSGDIEKNSPLIAELEKLSKHSGPISISGRVAEQQFNNVKGAKAIITGNGLNLETVTDDEGSYSFEVPRAGQYRVKVIVPFSASLMRRADDRPIDEKAEETQTVFEYSATASPDACDYRFFNTFKIDLKATASIAGVFILDSWKYIPRFYPSVCRLMPTEKETLKECRTVFY